MKIITLGVESINCIIESEAKAYGFDIFTYNSETGLINTIKKSNSSIFLKAVIKQSPYANKSNVKYVEVIIKSDSNINPSSSKSHISQDLSQANNFVEYINDQGFLFI